MPENYTKLKCRNCNKTLLFVDIGDGTFSISMNCTNSQCRHRNVFEFKQGLIAIDITPKICRVHAECKREMVPCKFKHREVEQRLARWAHNPKAAGSNPALAT